MKQKLSDKEWLVQATEGTHFMLYYPAFANVNILKQQYGAGYDYLLSYIKDGFCYWHYCADDLKRLTEQIIKSEKRSPGTADSLVKRWEKHKQVFLDACKEISSTDLPALSDQELAKAFDMLSSAYINEYSLPMLADAFSLYVETIIIDMLTPLLKKKGKNLASCLPILTAPVDQSFATEESISFLKLLEKVQKDDRLRTAVSEKDMDKIKENRPFFKALQQHVKSYFWTQNSYLRTLYLDESSVITRLNHALHIDAASEIQRTLAIPDTARKQKQALSEELGIKDDLKLVLRLVEIYALWMDNRKKYNLIADHYVMLFLDELCRRKSYNKDDWTGLIPSEFVAALKGDIDAKEIAERSRESFLIYTPGDLEILAGKDAEALFNSLQKEADENVIDFRGTCASPGKATGKVKIVMASKDINKMQEGDILVSSMTRPEVVPAMEKAAAIVTDEGGITCHAAIVSRELGIPCVVGTNIATRVLKDGDSVEVNANHGLIRKID
jgi:phosphohistidine swiveling domain-containing protein